MGISIKHDEYERLIRQLAEDRGTSLTEAIGVAVRNEINRGRKAAGDETFTERVRRLQALVREAPMLDPRTPDEIIGYDEYGLPN